MEKAGKFFYEVGFANNAGDVQICHLLVDSPPDRILFEIKLPQRICRWRQIVQRLHPDEAIFGLHRYQDTPEIGGRNAQEKISLRRTVP